MNRSSLGPPLFLLRRKQGTEAPKIVGRKLLVFDELRDQLLWRTLEKLVDDARPCAAPRGLSGHTRMVAVCLALGRMLDELLRLEIAEDRQHRGVGEVGGEFVADLADGA